MSPSSSSGAAARLGRTVRARASMEVAQTAAHIEALAKALRAGGVTVRSGAGVVALRTGR